MSSTNQSSTPAKRPRTNSIEKATEQSPTTPFSAARGHHRSSAAGGRGVTRTVATNKILGAQVSSLRKIIEEKDKTIAEKDAEIAALKEERRIHLEVISALGGDDMLAEVLEKNSSQSSGNTESSPEEMEVETVTEQKQEEREKDGDDEGEADTSA